MPEALDIKLPPSGPEKATEPVKVVTDGFQNLPVRKDPSLLNPFERIKNYNRAKDDLGQVRSFLAADHHARLRSLAIQEAELNQATEQLLSNPNLDDAALKKQLETYQAYQNSIFSSAFSDDKSAADTVMTAGKVGSSLGVGARLATAGMAGVAETAKPLIGWFSVAEGVRGAIQILKGRGSFPFNLAAPYFGKSKDVFEFTKTLRNAKDSFSNKKATQILQLTNVPNGTADAGKLKDAATTLAGYKRKTMELAWTNRSIGFDTYLPEPGENGELGWKKQHFTLKDIMETINQKEKELFDRADAATKKNLLKISLGIDDITGTPDAIARLSKDRVLNTGNEVLKTAIDSRWKMALVYALSVPGLTIPFVNVVMPAIFNRFTGGAPTPQTAETPTNNNVSLPMILKDGTINSEPIPQVIPTPEITKAIVTPTPTPDFSPITTMTPTPPEAIPTPSIPTATLIPYK